MASQPGNDKGPILVSGINGYIASQIGFDLLKQGHTVRGTTRSKESADVLLNGAYQPYRERIEIIQVPDITLARAFDEAVKDTTAIIHTASPISHALTTWSSTVAIATAGALSILDSALHHAGPHFRSFVLTSSFAACTNPHAKLPKTYTEDDWNTWAEAKAQSEEFEGLDDEAKGRVLYPASKTAAERAVWAWRDEKKPPFAICSVNPTIVMGPPLQPPPDPKQINMTLKTIWSMVSGQATHVPRPTPTAAYISLRDVSRVHIHCALHPDTSANHRFLLAAGRAPPQALADVLRRIRPQWRDRIPEGKPGDGYVADGSYGWEEGGVRIDYGRAKRALEDAGESGEWMGWEECVEETVVALERFYGHFL